MNTVCFSTSKVNFKNRILIFDSDSPLSHNNNIVIGFVVFLHFAPLCPKHTHVYSTDMGYPK